MNEELKNKWVEALRSGIYEQGLGHYFEENRYCVVGVLIKIMFDTTDPSKEQLDIINTILPPLVFSSLTYKNDIDGLSFDRLADYIDQNL